MEGKENRDNSLLPDRNYHHNYKSKPNGNRKTIPACHRLATHTLRKSSSIIAFTYKVPSLKASNFTEFARSRR